MISLIAAVAHDRVIGHRNTMPWNLPADFQWFKDRTFGKQLIVGRKTFESIGKKPLPDRSHVILTRQEGYEVPKNCQCQVAHSIDHALQLVDQNGEIMVCGGAIVYEHFLPLAHRMYLTYIHHKFEGDVFFPEFSMSDWILINRTNHHEVDEFNQYPFSILTLEKAKG